MPQDYTEILDYSRTPVDFLVPSGEKEAVTRARSCLGSLRFKPEEMEQEIGELSGGQKAKAAPAPSDAGRVAGAGAR